MTNDELIEKLTGIVQDEVRAGLDGVHAVIEQLRDEWTGTVGVLDGNDRAVMAELLRLKGSDVEQYAQDAGDAWVRFITLEYATLRARQTMQDLVLPRDGASPAGHPADRPVAKG